MGMDVAIGHLKYCNTISIFIFMNRGTKKGSKHGDNEKKLAIYLAKNADIKPVNTKAK